MGRRSIPHIEEKILEETMRLGASFGIGSISTRVISKHLHISEPVIYSRYKTKQGLFNAAYAAAWAMLPELAHFYDLFPDGKNFPAYQKMVESSLKKPDAILFVEEYVTSPYVDLDFIEPVTKPLVDGAVKGLLAINPNLTEEATHVIADNYLTHLIISLADNARSWRPREEATDFYLYYIEYRGFASLSSQKPAEFQDLYYRYIEKPKQK